MNIICPTDFSEHSINAVKYAAALAKDMKAELQIMTAYQIYRQAANFVNINELVRDNYNEDLKNLIATHIKNNKHISTAVVEGNPVMSIIKQSKTIGADLIVMGTQGANSVANILIGSITRKVASKSDIPVLAIPSNSDYKKSKNNILLAFDGTEIKDLSIFNIVMSIAEATSSTVDAIHISSKQEKKDPFSIINKSQFGKIFEKKIYLQANTLSRGISKYAEENAISMVVMVRRKKGFLYNLLIESNSDENLLMLDLPMLMLKEK